MKTMLKLLPAPLRRLLQAGFGGDGEDARSRRGAGLAFFIRVASAAIAFLSQILLARWLGRYEYGIFTYVWVWVNIVGTLATLGFAISAVRFLPQYLENGQAGLARGFLRAGGAVSLGSGLVCTLAGLVVLWLFDGVIAEYYRLPMALGLLILPAFSTIDFQDGVGRAYGWIDLALVPPYIVRPILLFAFIGLALALGAAHGADTAVFAAIAANWLTMIGQWALQARRLRPILPTVPPRYQFSHWARVSAPALLLEGFALAMINLDIVLLDIFVGPDEIAVYFASARTISLIGFVHFAVNAACMARFSASFSRGDITGVQDLFRASRGWTLFPSLAGAAAMLALGHPILWLFGAEFTAGYPLMFVLILGLLARAAVGPAQGLLVATGHQNLTAAVMGVTVACNGGLNLLLIPHWGLMGAAVATATAFAIESLSLYFAARHALAQAASMPMAPEASRAPAQ